MFYNCDESKVLASLTEALPFWIFEFTTKIYKTEYQNDMGRIRSNWLNMIQHVLFKLKYKMTYFPFPSSVQFFETLEQELKNLKRFEDYSFYNNFQLGKIDLPKTITQSYWGPKLWDILHCLSIMLQDEPKEHRGQFAWLVYLLPQIMLCAICSEHFKSLDRSKWSIKVFENPIEAVFQLHNLVNSHLGAPNYPFESFKAKYGLVERS